MGLISILLDNTVIFILIIISLTFALCIHEFSHGYIAYIYGDETAYRMGRLTLNPLAHLDPIGSMMILFLGIGYAKPVPVNPSNLRNPRKDMIKVAIAGPASNFILSFIGIQGIGYQIQLSLHDLLFDQVWTLLIFLVVLIVLVDLWSTNLRRKLME